MLGTWNYFTMNFHSRALFYVGPLCVVTLPNWMPIFTWSTARFVVKNGRHKDMLCDEIGLCVENILGDHYGFSC